MCYNNSSMPWNPLRWPNSFTTYLKAIFNLEQLIIKTMFTFYQTKSENMFKVQSKHCFHCMSLNWLFKVPFPKVVFYDGAGLEESPFHKWLEFLNWSLWVNGRVDKIIPWKNTWKVHECFLMSKIIYFYFSWFMPILPISSQCQMKKF